jgi:cullin 5
MFCYREWQDLFYGVHSVCLWDEKGAQKIRDHLEDLIIKFIKQAQKRVLFAGEEQALLKAYIVEWRRFFTQSLYLPLPFWQLEQSLQVPFNCLNQIQFKKILIKYPFVDKNIG